MKQLTLLLLPVAFAVPNLAIAAPSQADNRPVSREELKTVIRVLKKQMDRLEQVEKNQAKSTSKPKSAEEAVDLDALGSVEQGPGVPPIASVGGRGMGTHANVGAQGVNPTFRTFFDLNLINRPGVNQLTFDSFHTFLFFEIVPTPDLQFSFEVSSNPRFFELDYQMTKKLQLRFGKIWIPFDDLSPHNLFGGRVNTSRLSIGGTYLPDIWTDLGVGVKYQFFDSENFSLLTHFYLLNGFRAGGTDPTIGGGTASINYPNFSDPPTSADNNSDKAFGGRIHTIFLNKFGFGSSFYTGNWANSGQASKRMYIIGFDSQLRLIPNSELRFGWSAMRVPLPNEKFTRAGIYGEAGYKFGTTRAWKGLIRAGEIQLDSRINAISDQNLVGATLLYKPGLIEYSIGHSRDLKKTAGKYTYSYTALRIVVAL